MTQISQKKRSTVKIQVKQQGVTFVPPATGAVTLNNQGYAAPTGTATNVAGLTDVNLTSSPPINNSTLVYNSTTHKYDVELLDVDGGSF